MRRRILLCVGLILLVVSSACDLDQVFLADVELEIEFLPGIWTKFTCIEFGDSPFEMRAGDYDVAGRFIQQKKLPKKFKIRYQIENGEGRTRQRITHQYKIGRDGSFSGSHRLNADFIVPVGYRLCMYLLPKRRALIVGATLEFLNYQNSSLGGAGADRSPWPGS